VCSSDLPFFCDQRTGDPEKGGIGWMLLAEDLVRFCKAIHAERLIIVGHSIGGAVASMAEACFGPLAERMLLIEPIFLPEEFYSMHPTVRQHPMASKAIRRGNYWKDAAEARSYFLSRELFRSWDEEMLDLYIKHALVSEDHGLRLACSPRQEAALFMGDTQVNPWPLLKNIKCPVLVVEGGRSELKILLDSRKAAEGFPRGMYYCVENAGHLIPMENPRETRRIIRDFLND
jgi:pimeloyl-ACP methyl ester carboxylesterase